MHVKLVSNRIANRCVIVSQLQKLTDQYIQTAEELGAAKAKEISII